jgi:hypothetical protein
MGKKKYHPKPVSAPKSFHKKTPRKELINYLEADIASEIPLPKRKSYNKKKKLASGTKFKVKAHDVKGYHMKEHMRTAK